MEIVGGESKCCCFKVDSEYYSESREYSPQRCKKPVYCTISNYQQNKKYPMCKYHLEIKWDTYYGILIMEATSVKEVLSLLMKLKE